MLACLVLDAFPSLPTDAKLSGPTLSCDASLGLSWRVLSKILPVPASFSVDKDLPWSQVDDAVSPASSIGAT